jgi:hypothetical protein
MPEQGNDQQCDRGYTPADLEEFKYLEIHSLATDELQDFEVHRSSCGLCGRRWRFFTASEESQMRKDGERLVSLLEKWKTKAPEEVLQNTKEMVEARLEDRPARRAQADYLKKR